MVVLWAVLLLLVPHTSRGETLDSEGLVRINRALRDWLTLTEKDRPYLVLDREAGEIRLQHGWAVLRNCPVLVDSAGGVPQSPTRLHQKFRRYRPSDPWSEIAVGPFDWEQNLVEEATADCALFFSNRMLIYASEVWGRPRAPALQIGIGDLRALYDACDPETDLVILPHRWNEEFGNE